MLQNGKCLAQQSEMIDAISPIQNYGDKAEILATIDQSIVRMVMLGQERKIKNAECNRQCVCNQKVVICCKWTNVYIGCLWPKLPRTGVSSQEAFGTVKIFYENLPLHIKLMYCIGNMALRRNMVELT